VAQGETVETLQMILSSSVAPGTVKELRVWYTGTLLAGHVEHVRLILDENGNGLPDGGEPVLAAAVFPAALSPVTLAFVRTLQAGTTEKWVVVTQLSPTVPFETTFHAGVAVADISADVPVEGFDVLGPERTVKGQGAHLLIASLPVPTQEPFAFASNVPILQFEARVEGPQGVKIEQLRIHALGTGNAPKDVSRAMLWKDGIPIAILENPFAADPIEAVFTLAETISPGGAHVYLLTYDLVGWDDAGKTFQAYFDVDSASVVAKTVAPPSETALAPNGTLVMGPEIRVQPLVGSSGTDAEQTAVGSCSGFVVSARGAGLWIVALLALGLLWRRRGLLS